MPVEFTLPELGENVEKGDVIRVLVSPGDVVKADQAVLELETDKATIEVPTSVGGKVSEVKVKAGDKVSVGQVVLVLDSASGASGPSGAFSQGAGGGAPATTKEDSESASAGARASGGGAPRALRKADTGGHGRLLPGFPAPGLPRLQASGR